jgi:hypothetical protein
MTYFYKYMCIPQIGVTFFKVKNALVKSVYHVLDYTIYNLVYFCF